MMSVKKLRPALAWASQRVGLQDCRYRFMNLPHEKLQKILNTQTGQMTAYTVRDRLDLAVLKQVYGSEEYDISRFKQADRMRACYADIIKLGKRPLIIDCGANIGAATNYLGEAYPEAEIVAVEPAAGNFELLQAHCRSPRVKTVNAAIASEAKRGRVVDPNLGNCGMRVEAAEDGDLRFVTIGGLVAEARQTLAVPFMAKIDIEGYEQDLFSKNTEWLAEFPVVILELHDWMLPGEANSRNFLRAVSALNRDFVISGESVYSFANA